MTDTRTKKTLSLASLLADADLRLPDKTEAEWSAHDAKVAAHKAAAAARDLAQHQEVVIDAMVADRGFPARALRMSGRETSAMQAVQTWDWRARSVLILSGPKGCGKTVAACAWARQHRPHGYFVRASTFAASSRYDRSTRDSWLNASCLVLDDLGSEYVDVKGSLLADLDELFDAFYADERPLLITTNLPTDKSLNAEQRRLKAPSFDGRYGARIIDRLREAGRWINCDGESLRGKP